jgi:hypothetical protein
VPQLSYRKGGVYHAKSLTELMSQYASLKLLPFATVSARVPLHPFVEKVAPAQSPMSVVLMLYTRDGRIYQIWAGRSNAE